MKAIGRRAAALLALIVMTISMATTAFAAPACEMNNPAPAHGGHSQHHDSGPTHSMPACPHALVGTAGCTQVTTVPPVAEAEKLAIIKVSSSFTQVVFPHARPTAPIFHPPRI